MMKRNVLMAALSMAAVLLPCAALGYPNGPGIYLTDTGPFCASCHSAAKAEYMPELPSDAAQKEIPENKHYGLVRLIAPVSPYAELTDEQKEKVIKTAKQIDANSSVAISAPSRVKAGSEIKVTLKAKGGNGPTICVMLVDRALRYQARPVASDGWTIVGEPLVKGQDGAPQKTWLDRRIPGLKKNLNFIMIFDQKFDLEKNIFPSGEVTYTLKSPSEKGTYTLAAAFLYGTENTEKAGVFARPSGRILFSDELKIEVE